MTRIPSLLARLSAGLLSLSTLQLVAAQQLIPTTLPACAQTCALLQQASTSCMSNPAAAQSCFCQSALLAQVKTTPATNLCNGFCSAAEWGQIAAWYSSTCANGGVVVQTLSTSAAPAATAANGATNSIAAASGPAGTAQPTSGSTSNQAASGGSSSGDSDPGNYKNGQQWWAGHYQWVIMLIVLVVVFTGLGVGGTIWYRRRQKAKGRNSGNYSGGSASQWAPNSSTHDFNAQAERQARTALAQQPGTLGGAAMVERGNSRKGRNPMAGMLRKKSVR